MTEEDVGCFFKDPDGILWRMITFSDRPTAKLQKVGDDNVVKVGAIGSYMFDGFVKLDNSAQLEVTRALDQLAVIYTDRQNKRKKRDPSS